MRSADIIGNVFIQRLQTSFILVTYLRFKGFYSFKNVSTSMGLSIGAEIGHSE